MKPQAYHQLVIAAVAGFVFFTRLGATDLWDEDEAFFAATASEMHQRGDWIVPWYNGEVFAHKPPLMYWMMRVGFLLFGENELGARFFSAVFGLATALLTYHLGQRLFDAETAFWAGLAMSSCLMFSVVSRASTADAYLVFFITLSLWLYVRSATRFSSAVFDDSRGEFAGLIPTLWTEWIAIYIAMGFAVLVKGPIGVLLPGMTIGLFLLLRGETIASARTEASRESIVWRIVRRFDPRRVLRAVWVMRPFTAIGAVLLVAGPWFIMVGLRTGGSFLSEFFGTHNVGRFLSAMEGHRGPIVYYIPVALVGFFPWSIFVLPTIGNLVRRFRAGTDEHPVWLFLACWAVTMVGFFSVASTKLPNYILPAYPAFALLTAGYLRTWLAAPERQWRHWPRMAFGSLLLVGCAISTSIVVLTTVESHGQPLIMSLGVNAIVVPSIARLWWLGLPLVIAGVVSLVLERQQSSRASLNIFACSAPVFVAALLIVAAEEINPHQTSRRVTELIEAVDPVTPIAEYSVSLPSLIYYADQPVARLDSNADVRAFFVEHPIGRIVTTDEAWERIADEVDGVVVHEIPRFPKPGAMLVVGPRTTGLMPTALGSEESSHRRGPHAAVLFDQGTSSNSPR